MKALYDLPAPAKLNLFLHVTGRRADGYHLLQSVFMLLDWHDTLHFELRPEGGLSREDLSVSLPQDDLCLRAARALQQATGCAQGAHIAIDKRLPPRLAWAAARRTPPAACWPSTGCGAWACHARRWKPSA